jgi:type VI secretion system protein ImpL
VSEFFHPSDGVLWTFVRDQLGPYIYKHDSEWHERFWMGLSLGLNRSLIYALNNSQRITNSLFKRGGASPQMTFYLYPMPTPGISEISLETNGQMYRYRNEPQEWRKFEWPGQGQSTGASVVAISEKQNLRAEENQNGTWGIFHLFRKATVTKERGTQYLSQWKMEAYNGKPLTVSFRIRADRSENLLQPGLFKNFYIPRKIVGASETEPSTVASRG